MNAPDASNLSPALLNTEVNSFPADSREVKAGDLFFAFSQPEFRNSGFNGEFGDAHRFIPSAFEKGAAACVARTDRFDEHFGLLSEYQDRLVFVNDVIFAFQQLAHGVYLDWGKPVVGITGSAGKTTAKELTARVLECGGKRVLRNTKNLNNGLGHPMTVLTLAADPEYDLAVLEMGMSTPRHEIRRLCEITPLDYAIELNVLPVHLEHLGSIERVGEAKAELVEGLKDEGTAILNADDLIVSEMRELHGGRIVTYGIDREADIRAFEVDTGDFGGSRFVLETPDGRSPVGLRLPGRHNVSNALAAAAAGYCFGISPRDIASALALVPPPVQRGGLIRFEHGITVLDDSYNSNPSALLKMARTLIEGAASGSRTIVVAGEMLELGGQEKLMHRETGAELARMGIDMLIGVRGLAAELVEGARLSGLDRVVFCEDSAAAGDLLAGELRDGDVVLVKGSRGVRTERVVEKLREKLRAAVL